MPTQLSRGQVIAGDLKVLTGGKVQKSVVGTVARTDTAAKTLGVLPAGATIIGVTLQGAVASNAATTAVVSVGYAGGTGTEILNAFDVKGSGSGQQKPTTQATLNQPGSLASAAQTVVGKYTETGTASTTGGPWLVVVEMVTASS